MKARLRPGSDSDGASLLRGTPYTSSAETTKLLKIRVAEAGGLPL
jgi:hypothetical protein